MSTCVGIFKFGNNLCPGRLDNCGRKAGEEIRKNWIHDLDRTHNQVDHEHEDKNNEEA